MTCSTPFDVLIVEDEAILVMDLEMMIEDSGHVVVGEAASLYDVIDLADGLQPDIAFVDLQLARETSGLDVSALIQKRWPKTFIIFVTANSKKIPADLAGAHGLLPKPFSRNGIISTLRYIEEGLCDPPPRSAAPESFTASPLVEERWKAGRTIWATPNAKS